MPCIISMGFFSLEMVHHNPMVLGSYWKLCCELLTFGICNCWQLLYEASHRKPTVAMTTLCIVQRVCLEILYFTCLYRVCHFRLKGNLSLGILPLSRTCRKVCVTMAIRSGIYLELLLLLAAAPQDTTTSRYYRNRTPSYQHGHLQNKGKHMSDKTPPVMIMVMKYS